MQFTELKYSPEKSGVYVGMPQILRRSDGALLASHDYFSCGWSRNLNGRDALTSFYESTDDGRTWTQITYLPDATFGTLFERRGTLYFLSSAYEHGPMTIRKSVDGGYSWSFPRNGENGMLFPEGGFVGHPTPVTAFNGRLFKSVDARTIPEDNRWSPSQYSAGVISIPEDGDLLKAKNWTLSNFLRFDPAQCTDPGLCDANSGWLEGCLVEGPNRKLYNMLRIHLTEPNHAALTEISPDGREISFRYEDGLIDFFSGRSKFVVRFDPESGLYLSMTNEIPEGADMEARNVLILAVSPDLRKWRKAATLLTDDTGLSPADSVRYTGFQYVDWLFDGEDLVYLSRTAYRGAHSYHDSNRITFHRCRNFRKYLTDKQ